MKQSLPPKTENISFTIGDSEWNRLRSKAVSDLFWFNSVVLGFANHFKLLPETHLVIHKFMQRKTGHKEIDLAPVQMLQWPRETGKSTCGTIGYAIWLGCQHPNTAILIANEKEETAKDFIKSIRWHFESNALLRALFPEVIPPDFNKVEWSATRATLKRTTGRPEATFDCTGVGGTKVGKHYDVIICDDLIAKEGMENARRGSWTVVEETNRWVNQLEPMLSIAARDAMGPGFPFVRFIGTRWWMGDTYEHIEHAFSLGDAPVTYRIRVKDRKTGETYDRPVTMAGDLATMKIAGIEDGTLTFPLIWPQERLDKLRFIDPELFACNIQNNPSDAAIRTFKDTWLRYWKQSKDGVLNYKLDDGSSHHVNARDLIRVAVTDPAFSSGAGGSRAAIVVVGTDMETGKHLVLDVSAARKDPKDNLEDFLTMLQKWGVRRAYVELAGQQLAYLQWVEQQASKRGIGCQISAVKPGGRKKDERIEGLLVPFKNGDIYTHVSQSELIDDEYRHWRPGSRQADVLDALAYAMELVPKPRSTAMDNPRNRSRKQLDSYFARRGMSRIAR